MMKWKRSTDTEEKENPFNLSISDLMAGLLVIFMLALVSMFINYKDKVDSYHDAGQQREELLMYINEELKKQIDDGSSYVDKERGSIIIKDGSIQGANGVFDIGNDKLNENGRNKIQALVASIVASKSNKKEAWRAIDAVMIEGHADARGFGDSTSSADKNLELSTRRAINTWKFMREVGPKEPNGLEGYKNEANQPIFSVAGYGLTRPLLSTQVIVFDSNGQPKRDDEGKIIMERKEIDEKADEQRRIELRFIIRPTNPEKANGDK